MRRFLAFSTIVAPVVLMALTLMLALTAHAQAGCWLNIVSRMYLPLVF